MIMRPRYLKIMIVILLIAMITILSGCQAIKNLDDTGRELARLPDRLVQAFIDMLGGLRGIGEALANMVGDMVKNITGR